jgi:hypothetical protein
LPGCAYVGHDLLRNRSDVRRGSLVAQSINDKASQVVLKTLHGLGGSLLEGNEGRIGALIEELADASEVRETFPAAVPGKRRQDHGVEVASEHDFVA